MTDDSIGRNDWCPSCDHEISACVCVPKVNVDKLLADEQRKEKLRAKLDQLLKEDGFVMPFGIR